MNHIARKTGSALLPLLLPLLLAAAAQTAQAAPYRPGNGSEVIERLPRRADPAQRELAQLRSALAANPTDLALATRTAQRYIATARSETDPRYFGYAQAALAPWPCSKITVGRNVGAKPAGCSTRKTRLPSGRARSWLVIVSA